MANPGFQIYNLLSLNKNRQLSNYSLLNDIEGFWANHNQRIIENWYYYYGLQNIFMRRFQKEQEQDFLKRVKDAITENHVAPIVDIIVSNVYGNADSVKRYINRSENPDEELNKFFKESVWNFNHRVFDQEKALNLFVSGYSIIRRTFLDMRTNKPFLPADGFTDKVKYGYVSKKLQDSSNCLPLPKTDEDGTVYPNELGAILIINNYDNNIGDDTAMKLMGRQSSPMRVIEFIDDNVWLKWVKKENENKYTQVQVGNKQNQNKNPYGHIDIPFSLYMNNGEPFNLGGLPEVDKTKKINMRINELGNSDDDMITYHNNPILLGLGGAKVPADFVRTKNAIIDGITGNGKFEYLTWTGNLAESKDRQDALRRSLSHVAGVSLLSRGFLKDIGQIRSGPPLKALFSSDRAMMALKFGRFEACEKSDMRADVLFYSHPDNANADYKLDKTVSFNCEFNQDFLGIDKLLEEEIKALKRQAGTDTLDEILRTEHPDWSDTEIQKAIKDIEASQAKKTAGQLVKSGDKSALSQNN